MEEFNRDLYMPVNAPDADDIIQGIGAFEIYVYVIGFVICAIIGLVINSFLNNSIVALCISLGFFTLVVLTFRRDIYNENLIKKVKVFFDFSKSQKVYEYHYFNIYEVREADDEPEEE